MVTGDLNAEPGSDELRLLGGLLTAPAVPGLVLIDAWRYADPSDPGFTWDHRNGYQASTVLPDSRIDYILAGLPRQGRGKIRSAAGRHRRGGRRLAIRSLRRRRRPAAVGSP